MSTSILLLQRCGASASHLACCEFRHHRLLAPASFLLFLTHQKFTKSDENECSVLGPRDLLAAALSLAQP
jgi:hypothetical protein